MPLLRSSQPRQRTTRTTRTTPARSSRGGLFSRRRREPATKTTTTRTTAPSSSRGGLFSRRRKEPVQQRRKPSIGDKFSGAMLRLKGSLTRRPGQKAAGTRRMEGTDGRGSRRFTVGRRH